MIKRGCGNLLFLLGVTVASFCSCASDKKLVADASAAYIWEEWEYEEACVAMKGKDCILWHTELADCHKVIQKANEVQKVGKLPKRAKLRLAECLK